MSNCYNGYMANNKNRPNPSYLVLRDHVELLQGEGMLGVVNVAQQVEYFTSVERITDVVVEICIAQLKR